MKHQFIRRAAALSLALFLALAAAASMSAPARAASAPGLSVKNVSGLDTLIKGETIELEAVWSNGTGPALGEGESIEYFWERNDPAVSLDHDDPADPKVNVTAVKAGPATISVTAVWPGNPEGYYAEYTLMVTELKGIEINGEKAEDYGTMVIEEKATLTAVWIDGVEPSVSEGKGITYKWTSDDENVTFSRDNTKETTATVGKTAAEGAKPAITVTVTREGDTGGKDSAGYKPTLVNPQLETNLKITEEDVEKSKTLGIGRTATLTVKWLHDTAPSGVIYEWPREVKNVEGEKLASLEGTRGSRTVTAIAAGEVIIEVKATWTGGPDDGVTATCRLKVEDIPVTKITLNEETLQLSEGMWRTLTAAIEPDDASDKTVKWSVVYGNGTTEEVGEDEGDEGDEEAGDNRIVKVTKSKDNSAEVTVTALREGTVTIRATSADGNVRAECKVAVQKPDLEFETDTYLWNSEKPSNWELRVIPVGINPSDYDKIVWSIGYQVGETGTVLPQYTTNGNIITIVNAGKTPGKFTVTAQFKNEKGDVLAAPARQDVTISGLVLSGTRLSDDKSSLWMYIGDNTALTVKLYGNADDSGATMTTWYSSKPSVVSTANYSGTLNAWAKGTATITATKGRYSAECTVEVREDDSIIASGYAASAGEPMNLSVVWSQLNTISRTKTAGYGDSGRSYDLSYITNLKVSPNQGTLYYNYSTESDTGSGVGANDRFAENASGTIRGIDKLTFVPAQGFVGTAEIEFNGFAANDMNFAGIIRIEVSSGSGSGANSISYRTRAGDPVWFQAGDFDDFCQSVNGRSFNSVTFNLPKSSEGVLYYNYVAGSGNPVTSSIQFTPTGRYTVDDVCFVPNAAFVGVAAIGFRAVDSSGAVIDGTVTVNVESAGTGVDWSSVTVFGERGQPVTMQSGLFNDACRRTINDTLSFVTFELPGQTEGMLYYNYRSDGTFDSRVAASTRYYYSGMPGLSNVTFVPASSAAGRVAISYTGYGSNGASFNGTLYITLEEVDRTTIYYSVAKGGSVAFSTSDFNNAGLHQAGTSVTYVVFTSTPTDLGSLYYNTTTRVGTSSTRYYLSPTGANRGLGRVYFRAEDTAGTVTIGYTAYNVTNNTIRRLFDGQVVIQVGSRAPRDISLSCNAGGYADLSASTVNSACSAVMNGNLSYIEITGVPDAKEGRLYLDYNGFGTGTAVEVGDRFYRAGSSGISQLTFVPFARFAGEAEITYIGYSAGGQEQASGRILVNVSNAATSRYFNDMGDYTWAVDSVDYLWRNGTVKGVGGNLYGPEEMVKRGDFTLMLVRAYNLTATGSASFDDVPDDEYYADAIRIAALLGIVNGYNGNFEPEDALIRQDAMVMIYNTLKAVGKTATNGLAADLSAYYDEGQIDAYAREAMGSLVQMGVVKGDGNGYLEPQKELDRAEAAVLLHTIMTL